MISTQSFARSIPRPAARVGLAEVAIPVAFVQFLDFATTLLGMQTGGFEMNPVVRPIIDNFGIGGLFLMKVALTLGIISFVRDSRRLDGILMTLGSVIITAAVVISNLVQLHSI